MEHLSSVLEALGLDVQPRAGGSKVGVTCLGF